MDKKTKYSLILTSYKEPISIKKAIKQILKTDKKILNFLELIIVSPDIKTINSAKETVKNNKDISTVIFVKDKLHGKPAALNLAYEKIHGDIIIFTDGDMYLDEKAIPLLIRHFDKNTVGAVCGHPLSVDPKDTMFGFFSHLFCEAANIKRLNSKAFIPLTGYLYAIRNIKNIFPIPEEIRAEDGYITNVLTKNNLEIKYEQNAYCFVSFPKNTRDWLNQKIRSLGGNMQLKRYTKNANRNIYQDIKEIFLPFKIANSFKEYLFLLYLYPLRLLLWVIIIYKYHTNGFSKGAWKRIETTKLV